MRKTHPLRRAVLAGAGTVSAVVLLLALKPTVDPSLAQGAAGLGTPLASVVPADAGTASSAASPSASVSAAASPSASTGATGSASPSSARPFASRTPIAPTKTSAPTVSRTTPGSSGSTSAGSTTRSVAGATISTQYGSVQVQITVKGSTITGVTALKSPSSTPRSREISAEAVPQLNQRTMAAQSADIDSVSGATYTSAGYRQSLQSALDRADV
ncbi:FMN-binding protein [Streptomyces sp. NPDC051921]|uniref:FMN-binding protein n=1 Tax=Streptomyces sp. NPDC051921 TaxID=3155806 RepID=UPI00342E2F5B